ALTLFYIASTYRQTGQIAKALPYYEQSVPAYQKAGDKKGQAMALISVGNCYLLQHDAARAIAFMEQARQLVHEIGDKKLEIGILHNLGGIYGAQNDYPKAIATYQQVLPLELASGDKALSIGCLNNLSFLSFRVGDFLRSLTYLDQALQLETEAGTKSDVATTQHYLATNYSYLGQLERALEWEQKALRSSEESGDLSIKASILASLGRIYSNMQKPAEEKAYVEQSLALFQQIGDQNGEAYARHFLAMNRLAAEARKRFEATEDYFGAGNSLLQSGNIAASGGQFAEARDDYRRALSFFQRLGYVHGEANALAWLGDLEEQQGNLADAERYYAQALMRQEALRSTLGGLTEAKASFQELNFPLYQRYIRLLLQTRQNAHAFAWAQKAKARALIDLMEAGNLNGAEAMTPEEKRQAEALQRRDKELSQQWLAAMGNLDDLKRQARLDPGRRQKIEQQARAIQQKQQRLAGDWRAFQEQRALRDPRLALQSSARTVTLEEAASLLPEDTALLEYSLLKSGQGRAEREELALFVVTRKAGKPQMNVYRLKADVGAISRQARAFRDACAGRPDTPAERPYKDLARQLYHLLIAPAETALAGKRRLILCPDGPLWDVPFQALLMTPPAASARRSAKQTPSPAFLWERYEIVYAVSATGMKAALDARQRP